MKHLSMHFFFKSNIKKYWDNLAAINLNKKCEYKWIIKNGRGSKTPNLFSILASE